MQQDFCNMSFITDVLRKILRNLDYKKGIMPRTQIDELRVTKSNRVGLHHHHHKPLCHYTTIPLSHQNCY